MKFISFKAVCDLHGVLLAQFGGGVGLRDAGGLQGALGRAPNALAYDPGQTVAQLAAVYLHGIIKAHAFVDGNKRTAITSSLMFIELNGYAVAAGYDVELMLMAIAIADNKMTQDEAAQWFAQVVS